MREVLWCQPGQPGRVLAPQTWSGLVSGQSVIVKLETTNSWLLPELQQGLRSMLGAASMILNIHLFSLMKMLLLLQITHTEMP